MVVGQPPRIDLATAGFGDLATDNGPEPYYTG